MTVPDEPVDVAANTACIAADRLVRDHRGDEAEARAALNNEVKAAAKLRGVTDPTMIQMMQLGAAVTFGVRLALSSERTVA